MDSGLADDEHEPKLGNGRSNGNGILTPFEVESEQDSLLNETIGGGGGQSRASLFVRRRPTRANANGDGIVAENSGDGIFLGVLRSGGNFSWRNILLLAILGACVFFLTDVLDHELERDGSGTSVQTKPHHGSLGGDRNPGHNPNVPTTTITDDDLPKSNIGHAVDSLAVENFENPTGHYWHDPVKAVWASHLYQQTQEEAQAEQEQFADKMASVQLEFGQWNPPSFEGLSVPEYYLWDYKDVPTSLFPYNAWQSDATYLRQFLSESRALVDRVKFAIYREYGYNPEVFKPANLESYNKTYEQKWGVRVDNFKVEHNVAIDPDTGQKVPGVAFLNRNAWDGLVQKLLHAMMTQDEFYVVGIGGANTYQGNNFFQSQVMQFHYLMEPVFHKLGVQLVTRNMGMDATTLTASMAGANIYGESDIFWYIRDENNHYWEKPPAFDLMHKQALLSGERMPIILTPNPVVLMRDTNNLSWVGNIQPGFENCPHAQIRSDTEIRQPMETACWNVNCENPGGFNMDCNNAYDSVCWVNRTDVDPPIEQDPNVGHQGGNMNPNQHLLEGRKLAMLVLRGLARALNLWEKKLNKDEIPLAEEHWHVQTTYETLRESVRSLERTPGEAQDVPLCERLLKNVDPMICHMSMRGATEWTPRVNPNRFSLVDHVVDDLRSTTDGEVEVYTGIDVLPKRWSRRPDDYDAHMVAMATNVSTLGEEWEKSSLINDEEGSGFDDDAFMYLDDDAMPGDGVRRHLRRLAPIDPHGWTHYNAPMGFCDGSSQSTCNRAASNTCLMSNYNFYRAGILGHADSDWLKMRFRILEGVILARFEWSMDLHTGEPAETDSQLAKLPSDFRFTYRIDGVTKSKSLSEFTEWNEELAPDMHVVPLYINKAMSHEIDEQEDVEVAIKISSRKGVDCRVLLTHVYYA